MRDYTDANGNTWTSKQRQASLRLTKQAIARGELPAKPARCDWCGQDKGILQWHNANYSHPTKYLLGLCWRCHMVHHSRHVDPAAHDRYMASIKNGQRYPPVFRHSWGVLSRDHGFRRKAKPITNRELWPDADDPLL